VVRGYLTKNMITKNVSTLYSGVKFDDFKQKSNYLLSNKIICVGRLDNPIKNQSYIISEFSQIKDKINSDLYIVGDGKDYNFLHKLISNLNLNNRVFLLGEKSQDWLKNNLCNYDLFIQASKNEGLGLAPIESAAACLPMILSAIEGHLEVSENGKFCQLFSPYNEGELSKEILSFYENHIFYFKSIITNRNYLKSKFDFNIFNAKILDEYKKLI
jgi:glycosyltransferase involved in cell wall biosynthesis